MTKEQTPQDANEATIGAVALDCRVRRLVDRRQNMSMDYIRKTYGVPAKRGGRVRVDWYRPEPAKDGTITAADGARLRIRLDGEKQSRIAHPTWRVKYLPPNAEVTGSPVLSASPSGLTG